MVPPTNITSDARILIVDDDARCASGLARMLEKTGYTHCTAITSPIVVAENFKKLKPDLILLDLHMDPLSGIDLLHRINETTPLIERPPVIMLTADTTVEAKYDALGAGAIDFLSKPLDLLEVVLRIENLLTLRDLHQRCQLYSEGLERLLDKRTAELRTADLEKTMLKVRDAQRQVMQEERMRSLGTMAAGIAHDLNNGLFVILSYGDILLEDVKTFPPDSTARDNLERMVLAGQDNAELVKRLSAFHRKMNDFDHQEPVDLNQLIDQALSLAAPRWQLQDDAGGPQIRIKKDFGEIAMIAGNSAELREVLTNLIFNAVDAMPRGGRLCFRTTGMHQRVRLEVSDTGEGMGEEILSKCFEPFFTTKGDKGSGWGLAMTYGIIRRHAGTIVVDSQPKKGTTFTIFLPVPKEIPSTNGNWNQEATGRTTRLGRALPSRRGCEELRPATVTGNGTSTQNGKNAVTVPIAS